MSCPICKDTGWVEVPGVDGLDDAATTLHTCDCEAGVEAKAKQDEFNARPRPTYRPSDLAYTFDEERDHYLLIPLTRAARAWVHNFTDLTSRFRGAALIVTQSDLAGILEGARKLDFQVFDVDDNEGGG